MTTLHDRLGRKLCHYTFSYQPSTRGWVGKYVECRHSLYVIQVAVISPVTGVYSRSPADAAAVCRYVGLVAAVVITVCTASSFLTINAKIRLRYSAAYTQFRRYFDCLLLYCTSNVYPPVSSVSAYTCVVCRLACNCCETVMRNDGQGLLLCMRW